MESESWSLTIVRRLFTLSPVVLGAYNTLSSLDTTVYLMSVTKPYPDSLIEGDLMEVITYANEDYDNANDFLSTVYFSCDDENGKKIYPHATVNCPVTFDNNPAYLLFMMLWLSYFVLLGVYHLSHCLKYPVTDLRYFINVMNAENNKYMKYYIYFGMVLTVVTFVYAFHRSMTNPATSKVEVAQSQILFVFFNIFILKQYLVDGTHSVAEVCMETDFPDPIILRNVPSERHCSLWNLYGRLVTVDAMFEYLLRYVAMKHLEASTSGEESSVNPKIERALRVLYGERESSTARYQRASAANDDKDGELKTELLDPAASNDSL
jgi:hypothetical protein